MAKKKEEPYLLNDEEHLSEVDTQITKTYNDKDQESNPEEVSKAIKKANPEDVSYNEDGSISVKEGDVNEVEKTQVMKFDIKSSSDVKALQQMLDKGVDSKKMSVGTDGTISVSENKINLTKKEIMGIIKENKNFVSTKSDLLKTIKNRIISESRMNDNVRRKFESGDNDYNDILGQDLTNQLAQESFREIADNIRQKTGKENPSFMEIQQFLSNSLLEAAKEEYRLGTENLERKAVAMIRKQFNIPEDAVEFDAKIMGIPPAMLGVPSSTPQTRLDQISRQQGFKIGDIKREGLKFDKGNKPKPEGRTEEQIKPALKRRRLTNSMMHGAARKSQNLHHLDDELRQTNPTLGRNYSNVMAANDANYFLMDDDSIKQQGMGGIHAGNVKLDISNPDKPKIIAQGIIFPILLHELAKGVVELMSLQGLSDDVEVRKYVLDKTDNLESETNDIRLGTKIWEKFVAQIPTENQEVISLTWSILQELPDTEFNSIIEGLIKGDGNAQQKVRGFANEALEELRGETAEDVLSSYSDDYEDENETPESEEEDVEDELLNSLLKQKDDTEEEVDYESMSKVELQNLIDDALDAGDMELVRQLGSILNKK